MATRISPADEVGSTSFGPGPSFTESEHSTGLSREDAVDVVARNSDCVIRHELDDGSVRVHRLQYAWVPSALFLPAWTSLESLSRGSAAFVECYVNELDSGVAWRVVRLRGRSIPLLPTGDARERDQWRTGVGALRSRIQGLAQTEDLALANFGIVRVDLQEIVGNTVPVT